MLRLNLLCTLGVSLSLSVAGCGAPATGGNMAADTGMNGNTGTDGGNTGNTGTDGGNTGGTTTTMMSETELRVAMETLTAINTHRTGKGLAAYTWHAAGAEVGYAHSLAMQQGGFFEHVDPNTNTDPATRALQAGIMHDPEGFISPDSGNPFVGENLFSATGQTPTGQAAVDSWVTSPGHHTQIDAPMPVAGATTMPSWTHCGIGVRILNDQSWYTAMFFKNPN